MNKPYISPYLMIAEGCNLKCSYCYEHKKQTQLMSIETFDKSMAYLQEHYLINSVVLFGGEPTLNTKVLNHAIATLDESIEIVLITNGVRVDDTTLALIKNRKNIAVQVSLDGTLTTMHERIFDNETLFNQIIENSKRYKEALLESGGMSFHSTITKTTVGSIYENIMFLLGLNLTHWINTTTDFNSDWTAQDYFLYETQFMMISDYIRENPIQGEVRTLHCQESSSKYQYGCPAGVQSLIINATGSIYPCSRLYTNFGNRFLMGHIDDNKPADGSKFEKLNYNTTKCGGCEINNCIRCYAANLELNDDLLAVNPAHCGMSKLNLKLTQYHTKNVEDKK